MAARQTDGVEILGAGATPPEDAGPPLCKVCGDEIVDTPHVVCSTCRTPHHRDCWEFIGGCSIFGCKGKHAQPA